MTRQSPTKIPPEYVEKVNIESLEYKSTRIPCNNRLENIIGDDMEKLSNKLNAIISATVKRVYFKKPENCNGESHIRDIYENTKLIKLFNKIIVEENVSQIWEASVCTRKETKKNSPNCRIITLLCFLLKLLPQEKLLSTSETFVFSYLLVLIS